MMFHIAGGMRRVRLDGPIAASRAIAFQTFGALAQLVEHIVHIDGVTGSSPVGTTKKPSEMAVLHQKKEANCVARIIHAKADAVAKLFACVFLRK